MRIRVSIDVSKPLTRVMHLTGPNRQKIQIRFAYEKMPNFCYLCGLLGHLVHDCPQCVDLLGEKDRIDEGKLAYGDWLRFNNAAQNNRVVHGSLGSTLRRPTSETTFFSSARDKGILGKSPVSSKFGKDVVNSRIPGNQQSRCQLVEEVGGSSGSQTTMAVRDKGKRVMDTNSPSITHPPYIIPPLRNPNYQAQLVIYQGPNTSSPNSDLMDQTMSEPSTQLIPLEPKQQPIPLIQSEPKNHHPYSTQTHSIQLLQPNTDFSPTASLSLPKDSIHNLVFQSKPRLIRKFKPTSLPLSLQPDVTTEPNSQSVPTTKKRGRPCTNPKTIGPKSKSSVRKNKEFESKKQRTEYVESSLPEAGAVVQPRLSQ